MKRNTSSTAAKKVSKAPAVKKAVKRRVVPKKPLNKVGSSSASASSKSSKRKKIAPEKHFWVHHGPIVRDLGELCDALQKMSDEQFFHHTRREAGSNDFARWVDEVLEETVLAQKILKVRSRLGARRIIVAHISL